MAIGKGSRFPSVISISIIDHELEVRKRKNPKIEESFFIILKFLLDQSLVEEFSSHHIYLYQALALMDRIFLQP